MRLLFATLILLGLAAPSPAADPVASFATLEQTWHDAARNREVPVKIYYPVAATAPCPVILFSHGLGGSREGYRYLGEYWAAHGFVSVHLQHLGSDTDALRGLRPMQNFKKIASDPANAINRPLDIAFAINQLTALNQDHSFTLAGRLDLGRLGLAGHSFGAFTTMAMAGARIPALGSTPRFLDSRIKAAIAMSTPANPWSDTDEAFADVKIPVFHMTGTKDGSNRELRGSDEAIVGDTTPAQRLLPYRHTQHAPAWLLVLAGGDHMVFSGRLTGSRPSDRACQDLVCRGSVAFWDSYLRQDTSAKQWLNDGGFSSAVGSLGTFEHKQP